MGSAVRGSGDVDDDLVVQQFLEEGVGRVAAGDLVPGYQIEDAGCRGLDRSAWLVPPQGERQAGMSHQPALLRREDRA